jgi:hypothetical protein
MLFQNSPGGSEENRKNPVTTGIPAEQLQNKNLERYRCINPLGTIKSGNGNINI